MKSITKLMGILIASTVLFACDGGSSIKTEKVWKLVEKKSGNKIITFDYDGSGYLIRQNHSDSYYEFDYDNEGVLLTRKDYKTATKKLTRLIKFDERGEMVLSTRGDSNGKPIMPADKVYVNTYNGDERDLVEEKKLVQRKILKITTNNPQYFYLGSKLVSSDRSGTADGVLYYTSEGNKMTAKWHDKPDDGNADYIVVTTYNKRGDIVSFGVDSDGDGGHPYREQQQNEYVYDLDANGNLKKSVMINHINNLTTTTYYKWTQIAVPVSN